MVGSSLPGPRNWFKVTLLYAHGQNSAYVCPIPKPVFLCLGGLSFFTKRSTHVVSEVGSPPPSLEASKQRGRDTVVAIQHQKVVLVWPAPQPPEALKWPATYLGPPLCPE